MKQAGLAIMIVSVMAGCATTQYASDFNEAVGAEKSTVIITAEPFDALLESFNEEAAVLGYDKVIHTSKDGSFMVLVGNAGMARSELYGDIASHKMMVKFTQWEDGQTRLDLVNGTTYVGAKSKVQADITALAQKFSPTA
ncbi:MAG: hypothetical protein Q8R76_00380 [Candidatus Omnitrophota bacterium]|nr:hypothetical protein [Candidatus Omnitrophota bacterium]